MVERFVDIEEATSSILVSITNYDNLSTARVVFVCVAELKGATKNYDLYGPYTK